MDAVFRVNASEFDEKLFQQIKSILNLRSSLEVTISISDSSTGMLRQETREEYFERLLKAKNNFDHDNKVVNYQADQFEEFQKFLLNEP